MWPGRSVPLNPQNQYAVRSFREIASVCFQNQGSSPFAYPSAATCKECKVELDIARGDQISTQVTKLSVMVYFGFMGGTLCRPCHTKVIVSILLHCFVDK